MKPATYHRSPPRATGALVGSAILVAGLLFGAAPARALESAPATTARTTVTLISEADSVAPGQAVRLGLRFRLAPGWHIYWQNPGDAGMAPEVTWTLPDGASAGPIAWPAPVRLPEGPLMAFGYTGEMMLPVTMTVPQGGAPLSVEGHANWLVCEKICVPEEATLRLTLPPGTAAPSPQAPLFAAADARMPRPSPFAATIAADGTLLVAGQGLSDTTVADAWFFPSVWGAIEHAAPQRLTVQDGSLSLALTPGQDAKPGQPLSGVLALRDRTGSETFLTIDATPGAAIAASASPATPALAPPSLWQMLGFAFLGGLLLNLMPCVFPVLAIKALGIARLSGRERGEVRAQAASYTVGVVLGCLALGGVMLALRGAGSAAGWGFQFQSPVFVALVTWLLFGVGLNLSGVFEIGGGRLAGAGQSLTERGGHAGSFFTGLLAVLVATPCTAPFMGAAIAASLAAPVGVTLAVFAVLGLGLASPYAMLALAPGLAAILPRPGAWMEVVRQALAFPIYAACVWLVWVVSLQSGPDGVLAVAAGLVLLAVAAWAFGWAQTARSSRGRWLGRGAAVVSVLAIIALVPPLAFGPARSTATGAGMAALPPGTEPFSADRLAALRAEGRPVFVDMTAAWCVSCLVNERVALDPQPVRDAFAARGVVTMRGDWTRQDPAITAFLREHGRDGVPLYVFYPPGGEPAVLPQILTQGTVLDHLARMGG